MSVSYCRFEEIKQIIADINEDYNLSAVPFDITSLITKMNIRIVYLTSLPLEKQREYYKISACDDAFIIKNKKTNEVFMYVNDLTSSNRQRFSMAHELMHYILEHKEQSVTNECEANFGANYLLMPGCILLIPSVINEISKNNYVNYCKKFKVSAKTFEIALLNTSNRCKYGPNHIMPYEKIINKQVEKEVKALLNTK